MRHAAALGLRDALVPLDEQLEEQQTERVVVARIIPNMRPGNTWEPYTGTTWRTPWGFAVDRTPADVGQVSTRTFPRGDGLQRAESLSDCTTTPNTWFYDLAEGSNRAWWDRDFAFDTGASWDGYPYLYLNLGGPSPVDELASIGVEILASTRGTIQPTFGPDKLDGDGDFETWSPNPAGWTVVTSDGGSAVAGAPYAGARGLRLDATLAKEPVPVYARRDGLNCVAGACYVAWGYYRTPHTNPDQVQPLLRVLVGSSQYTADGRDVVPVANGFCLRATRGRWRYFAFAWRARGRAHQLDLGLRNATGAPASGSVEWDGVQVRRVWRFARHHGRIAGSVTIESGGQTPWFGGKQVGVSTLRLNNTDGAFDHAWQVLAWDGAYVEISLAGRIEQGLHGSRQGAPLSDARRQAAGYVDSSERSDTSLDLAVEELRTIIYGRRAAPNVFPSDLPGQPDPRIFNTVRQLVVGDVAEVQPARLDVTEAGHGVYEVADCSLWPAGIQDLPEVRLYADSDAASRKDPALSLDLTGIAGVIAKDLASGRFTALSPINPYQLDSEHEYFSIQVNGVTYHPRLLAGAEQVVHLDATADGQDGQGLPVGGAPTLWQALLAQGDGHVRGASSTVANEYVSVAVVPCPPATSVMHVTVQALVHREPSSGWAEGTTDFVTLYLRDKESGTRYESGDGQAQTGVYWKNPFTMPVLISHTWDVDPSDGQPWTQARVDHYEPGYRYRKGNAPGYLVCDFLRPEVRLFSATPPSAAAPGLCIPLTLAQRLQAELRRAAASGDITVTLEADYRLKFSASRSIVTFALLTSTGKQKSGWGWIGANTTADKTGALTYTLDAPLHDKSADIDKPLLRCRVRGYRDDASGTYTGTPGGLIERPSDVTRFLLVVFFKLPAGLIHVPSFVAARAADAGEPLAMLLREERTVRDVVDGIEHAAQADIVFVPNSLQLSAQPVLVQFRPLARALSGYEPHVRNADWKNVRASRLRSKAAAVVEVTYGRSQARQGVRSRSNPAVPILRRSEDRLKIETDLRSGSGAKLVADATADLHEAPEFISGEARGGRLQFAVASDTFVASLARLGYQRTPCRLWTVRHDLSTGLSEIQAVRRTDLEG